MRRVRQSGRVIQVIPQDHLGEALARDRDHVACLNTRARVLLRMNRVDEADLGLFRKAPAVPTDPIRIPLLKDNPLLLQFFE